jgi:hypothetical protein
VVLLDDMLHLGDNVPTSLMLIRISQDAINQVILMKAIIISQSTSNNNKSINQCKGKRKEKKGSLEGGLLSSRSSHFAETLLNKLTERGPAYDDRGVHMYMRIIIYLILTRLQ